MCSLVVPMTSPVPLFDVGQVYDHQVLDLASSCEVAPGEVAGVVTDYDNAEVVSEWSLRGRRVFVRFTPRDARPHHFIVRIQPNVALAQGDLVGAVVRSPARRLLEKRPLIHRQCESMHLLPSGTLLCDGIEYLADGGRQDFGELVYERPPLVTRSAVWTQRFGSLRRWVEADGGVVASGPADLDGGVLLAANDDSAWGNLAGQKVRWSVDGGDLSVTALGPRDPYAAAPFHGLTPDAGAFWVLAPTLAFCLSPTAAGDAELRCLLAPSGTSFGEVVDGDGLWFRTFPPTAGPTGPSLLNLLDEHGVLTSAIVPAGHTVRQSLTWTPGVELAIAVLTDAGTFQLERIPGAWLEGWVDGDKLLLLSGDDGELQVLER